MTDAEPSATTGTPGLAPGVADEQFAVRIREERERRKWSQADVARFMTGRGWGWHPQTVQKIEAGHRKVTVGEGKALAEIFETTVDRLTWPGREASASSLLLTSTVRAEQAYHQISEWTYTLRFNQWQLERTVSGVERDGYFGSDEVRKLAEAARRVMELTPEEAVKQAGHPGDTTEEGESD